MLTHNELKRGVQFILEQSPHEVLDSSFTYKGRGSSTVQAKIKNLRNGNIITKTFHAGDELQETELEKKNITFIYSNKGKYIFSEQDKPSNRFELTEEQIGEKAQFLISNAVAEGLVFDGEIINISVPIKMSLKVKDAPPGLKGDRSQGGTKAVTLENDIILNVPLFIETGDVIELNTETGEYVRRIEKG